MKVELKSCSLSAATAYSLRVQCCQSEIQSATSVSSLSIRCCQLSVGDNRVQILAVYILLLIFLCWRYNPLWVLAFLVIFFHSALSILSFLHPLIPIIWMSSSTSSIRLFLDLPLILLPIGFHSNILLGVLPPSIHITCPSQAIFGSIYIYLYECQTLRLQNMLNFNPQTKPEPNSQTLIDMKLRIILICIAHLLIAPFMKDISTTNRIEKDTWRMYQSCMVFAELLIDKRKPCGCNFQTKLAYWICETLHVFTVCAVSLNKITFRIYWHLEVEAKILTKHRNVIM